MTPKTPTTPTPTQIILEHLQQHKNKFHITNTYGTSEYTLQWRILKYWPHKYFNYHATLKINDRSWDTPPLYITLKNNWNEIHTPNITLADPNWPQLIENAITEYQKQTDETNGF